MLKTTNIPAFLKVGQLSLTHIANGTDRYAKYCIGIIKTEMNLLSPNL